MRKKYIFLLFGILIFSCENKEKTHDASGTFEATEIIISSEVSGKLKEFNVEEGQKLTKGQYLGYVDSTQLYLQKLQLQAASKGAKAKQPNLSTQISVAKEQLAKAEFEKKRVEELLKDNAATQKQLDDVNSQIKIIKNTINAQTNQISTSIDALNQESDVYRIQMSQVEDQLEKSKLLSPIDGTVLNKYSEANELVAPGRPLYKIADVQNMFLRVYVVSTQLEKIKIGQAATVYINAQNGSQKSYEGTVSWISDKAEFTPKTIQTQDERQNLVYAVKILVANTDGNIKIGMYGDADFNQK